MKQLLVLLTILGSLVSHAAPPICQGTESFVHDIAIASEENLATNNLVAKRITLEWIFDDRNKYRIEHDFSDNQTRVDCLSMTSPISKDLSENHKFVFPTLLKENQIKIWQMSTLLASEKLGFWLQPNHLLSDKFSPQVVKDFIFTSAGDRQIKAEKKYQTGDGQFYIKIIFDHQPKL